MSFSRIQCSHQLELIPTRWKFSWKLQSEEAFSWAILHGKTSSSFAESSFTYVEEEIGVLLHRLTNGFIIGWGVFRFVESVYQHLLLVLVSLLLILHLDKL